MQRSPMLMQAENTALIIVDVQEKLLPVISKADVMLWNIRRLLETCRLLGLEIHATEQYPERLGKTVSELSIDIPKQPVPKRVFSCQPCSQIFDKLKELGIKNILLCGIELHVCVQQSSLDLFADGFEVYIPVDAVGSRNLIDYEFSLRRLGQSGVHLTTTESAMFELCYRSDRPEFKSISQLVKDKPPNA
ncbi:MAG: hydrolase [Prochlorococcus sp.]